MTSRLKLQLGDITAMNTEAVVNSTDHSMAAGGPVHVAIHNAAGPGLGEECLDVGVCPPGEARITGGHNLSAPFVIHTVAPTWLGGTAGELKQLASCYHSVLRLAKGRGIRSVAFPSIGSGTQPQIPLDQAAPLAVRTWIHSRSLAGAIMVTMAKRSSNVRTGALSRGCTRNFSASTATWRNSPTLGGSTVISPEATACSSGGGFHKTVITTARTASGRISSGSNWA